MIVELNKGLFVSHWPNSKVTRSLVVDSKTGASKLDDIRTSFGGVFG